MHNLPGCTSIMLHAQKKAKKRFETIDITEEILRTLVGSLGLMAAVPVAIALASFLAVNSRRLPKAVPFLGNVLPVHEHSHIFE